MPTVTTPNIMLPICFKSGDLEVVEMDTAADYKTKAEVVLRFRPGDCDDLPEFGSPGLLGKLAPLDLADIAQALATWVPEANYRLSDSGDPNDPVSRRVLIQVDEPSVDQ